MDSYGAHNTNGFYTTSYCDYLYDGCTEEDMRFEFRGLETNKRIFDDYLEIEFQNLYR